MIRKVLLHSLLLFLGSGYSQKADSHPGSEALYPGSAILKVESSIFSFLILDSIPMGKITRGTEIRLLTGPHRIQIHNVGSVHFDTTITLGPGMTLYKRTFREREDSDFFKRGQKKKK
jgi:hypothetical protein